MDIFNYIQIYENIQKRKGDQNRPPFPIGTKKAHSIPSSAKE